MKFLFFILAFLELVKAQVDPSNVFYSAWYFQQFGGYPVNSSSVPSTIGPIKSVASALTTDPQKDSSARLNIVPPL